MPPRVMKIGMPKNAAIMLRTTTGAAICGRKEPIAMAALSKNCGIRQSNAMRIVID